jgi:hypothetical protein
MSPWTIEKIRLLEEEKLISSAFWNACLIRRYHSGLCLPYIKRGIKNGLTERCDYCLGRRGNCKVNTSEKVFSIPLCLIQMMYSIWLESVRQILSILKYTKMDRATLNALLSSCELLGIAWLFYYHYSVIDKIVHVSLDSRCDHETSLHIRGPFSKLNRFLPVAFSQRTHPLLPTDSLVPLASSSNALTSP